MTKHSADPVADLCEWSPWVPFAEAIELAPRLPGVYMAREGSSGPIIYVGMSGERRGSRDRPQGIRGRLRTYARGKGLASGLGEAVFDRALADVGWLRERLTEVEGGTPRHAAEWGKEAFARAALYVRWGTVKDRSGAADLEKACLAAMHDEALWNRLK